MSLPPGEQLLASATRFLIDGGEDDAASILLACSIRVWAGDGGWSDGEWIENVSIDLEGPRSVYEIFQGNDDPTKEALRRALEAVLPSGYWLWRLSCRAALLDLDPGWRTELLEIARGKGVRNQATGRMPLRTWKNLGFRSASEVRIAEALDRAGVLFLPNCRARLSSSNGQLNREADFLVCVDGRWGILEVDGEPFHPASRTVEDHSWDRLFKAHGIRIVEHFDASDCYEDPDGVVTRFLELLKRS